MRVTPRHATRRPRPKARSTRPYRHRPDSRLMLVVTLGQVVMATMIPPGQDFINIIKRLALALILHWPRLELDHGLLRQVDRFHRAEDAVFIHSPDRTHGMRPSSSLPGSYKKLGTTAYCKTTSHRSSRQAATAG